MVGDAGCVGGAADLTLLRPARPRDPFAASLVEAADGIRRKASQVTDPWIETTSST
jgi:hypothetical protein